MCLLHCHRAAVAPFLAAKEMGLDTFKWVLYGDDDTVFFVDGALDALENLDYNMPYLLSDDVWFVEDDGEHHTAIFAPLPCLHKSACHAVHLQTSTHLDLHNACLAPATGALNCPCLLLYFMQCMRFWHASTAAMSGPHIGTFTPSFLLRRHVCLQHKPVLHDKRQCMGTHCSCCQH